MSRTTRERERERGKAWNARELPRFSGASNSGSNALLKIDPAPLNDDESDETDDDRVPRFASIIPGRENAGNTRGNNVGAM